MPAAAVMPSPLEVHRLLDDCALPPSVYRFLAHLVRRMDSSTWKIGGDTAKWDHASMRQIGIGVGYCRRHIRRLRQAAERLGLLRTTLRKWSTSVFELVPHNLVTLAAHGREAKARARVAEGWVPAVDRVLGDATPPERARDADAGGERTSPAAPSDVARALFPAELQVGINARVVDRLVRDASISPMLWRAQVEDVAWALRESLAMRARGERVPAPWSQVLDGQRPWTVKFWPVLAAESKKWRTRPPEIVVPRTYEPALPPHADPHKAWRFAMASLFQRVAAAGVDAERLVRELERPVQAVSWSDGRLVLQVADEVRARQFAEQLAGGVADHVGADLVVTW